MLEMFIGCSTAMLVRNVFFYSRGGDLALSGGFSTVTGGVLRSSLLFVVL